MPKAPMRTDEWWKKRVGILESTGAKVADLDADVLYEKHGYWPLIKLVLMQYFVGPYATIMNARRAEGGWDRLHFIDLCAGSGLTRIYAAQERHKDAPPRVVAGSAIIGANEPRFDQFHFVEPGKARHAALGKRVERLAPGKCTVYRADAGEALPRIVDAIRAASQRPHFLAIVDPEGITEVTLEDLRQLLAVGRGDVIFNFQYQALTRAQEQASAFLGRTDWPRGSDDEIREFFRARMAELGRPAAAYYTVKAGVGRYAYEIAYFAAATSSRNIWMQNIDKDLARHLENMDGMGLEDILLGGQQTLF